MFKSSRVEIQWPNVPPPQVPYRMTSQFSDSFLDSSSQQPSTSNTTNYISLPNKKLILETTHQRALDKIASLEVALEYQSNTSSEQLKSLHQEITRLQTLCSELHLKLSKIDVPLVNSAPTRPRKEDKIQENDESLSVIFQKQKQKYALQSERWQSELRKQKNEVDRAKAEVEILKEVLLTSSSIRLTQEDINESVQMYLEARKNIVKGKSTDKLSSKNVIPPIESGALPNPPEDDHRLRPTSASLRNRSYLQKSIPILADETHSLMTGEKIRIAALLLKGEKRGNKDIQIVKKNKTLVSSPPETAPQQFQRSKGNASWAKKVNGTREVRRNHSKNLLEHSM